MERLTAKKVSKGMCRHSQSGLNGVISVGDIVDFRFYDDENALDHDMIEKAEKYAKKKGWIDSYYRLTNKGWEDMK